MKNIEEKTFKIFYASDFTQKEQQELLEIVNGSEDIYLDYTAHSSEKLKRIGWEKDSIANKLFKWGASEEEECLIRIDLG